MHFLKLSCFQTCQASPVSPRAPDPGWFSESKTSMVPTPKSMKKTNAFKIIYNIHSTVFFKNEGR